MEHLLQNLDLVGLTIAFVQLFKPLVKAYVPELWQRLVLVGLSGLFGMAIITILYCLPETLLVDGGLYGFAAAGLISLLKEFTRRSRVF